MISSNPTAEERVQYVEYLDEANVAYHRLLTGAAEVSLGYNGETVSYTAASKPQLSAYIAQLRSALGMAALKSKPVSFRRVSFR